MEPWKYVHACNHITRPAPAIIPTSPDSSAIIATHMVKVSHALKEIPVGAVHRVAEIFRQARDRGSPFIYIAGNGGSSSTASHWVNSASREGYEALELPAV